jgi:hypothetical protein
VEVDLFGAVVTRGDVTTTLVGAPVGATVILSWQ